MEKSILRTKLSVECQFEALEIGKKHTRSCCFGAIVVAYEASVDPESVAIYISYNVLEGCQKYLLVKTLH